MLSENSSLVSWKSRSQPTIALLTYEAEYMALTSTIQEGLFLKQLLSDILDSKVGGFIVNVDNIGSLELAKNPVHHNRSKHIDVKFHFIRQHVLNKDVFLKYVRSKQNIANIFTKACTRGDLENFKLIS